MFNYDETKKQMQQTYQNIHKFCLNNNASSSLLEENCVVDIFNKLNQSAQIMFIHYLQNKIGHL